MDIQKMIEEEAERQYKNHEPYVKAVYCELAAKWGEFALSLTNQWIEIKEGGELPKDKQNVWFHSCKSGKSYYGQFHRSYRFEENIFVHWDGGFNRSFGAISSEHSHELSEPITHYTIATPPSPPQQ